MKVNFDTVLNQLDGKPMKDESGKEITLATPILISMVQVVPQEDANVSADEKVNMFKLSQKAHEGGEQDVTSEEITLIKKRVAKFYGALVVGRVIESLEGGKLVSIAGGKRK